MLKFALLCGLVALVAADQECGHLDIIRVKTQWAEAYGDESHRDAFGQALWRALFHIEPHAADLFDRVHGDDVSSPEFSAHSARVLGSLDLTIALLDDPEAMEAHLHHLHDQHEERHIPNEYFNYFETALIAVVKARVNHCFDEGPWHACYDKIAHGITG